MKLDYIEKYPVGLLGGFVIGAVIIHPFSMVFQGMFLPLVKINLGSVIHAFHPQHLPMAFFFGLLGMGMGMLNVFYLKTITKEEKRIKILEGLLPICSYCKKIRDDSGTAPGEGEWSQVEDYFYMKADQEFTHGICPECVDKVFGSFKKEKADKHSLSS